MNNTHVCRRGLVIRVSSDELESARDTGGNRWGRGQMGALNAEAILVSHVFEVEVVAL